MIVVVFVVVVVYLGNLFFIQFFHLIILLGMCRWPLRAPTPL